MQNVAFLGGSRLTAFARVVSLVLSPLLLWPALFIYLLSAGGVAGNERVGGFIIVFGIGVIPSLVILILLRKSGFVSDWELRVRKERYVFNLLVLACGAVMAATLSRFGFEFAAQYTLVALGWFLLFTLITFFWKISAHTGSSTLVLLLITHAVHKPWWWIIPAIILVGWSRVHTQNHTPLQAVAGSILAGVVYMAAALMEWI